MYEAVIHNDANCDGRFFYGVLSTGIFCRLCKRCRSNLSAYHPMEDAAEAIRRHLEEWYAR